MSAQIEMEPSTEALMLLEAEHRAGLAAWERTKARELATARFLRLSESVIARYESEHRAVEKLITVGDSA
jgi:hypothetical protein